MIQLWNLLERKALFDGADPTLDGEYTSRAHLAQIISLLDLPPEELLASGTKSGLHFNANGMSHFRTTQFFWMTLNLQASSWLHPVSDVVPFLTRWPRLVAKRKRSFFALLVVCFNGFQRDERLARNYWMTLGCVAWTKGGMAGNFLNIAAIILITNDTTSIEMFSQNHNLHWIYGAFQRWLQ